MGWLGAQQGAPGTCLCISSRSRPAPCPLPLPPPPFPAEYQQLLGALTDPDTVPATKLQHPELLQASKELPHMKAALERTAADAYDSLQLGAAPRELQRIAALRTAKRAQFEAQFAQHLAKQEAAGGADYLADLPAHCLRESAGERVLVASGLVALLLQAASAYVALGLSLRLPVKSA